MSYNLLKSLYIKYTSVNGKDFEYLLDFTKISCCYLTIKKYGNNYSIIMKFRDLPDEEVYDSFARKDIISISYILNNNIKCTIKEDGLKSLETFDNIIRLKKAFYIFPIDDFNLKLSREIYSAPIDKVSMEKKQQCECEKVSDFGVVVTFDIDFAFWGSYDMPLSIIDIAFGIIKDKCIFYDDAKGRYKLVLTDKGNGLISKYKMAMDSITKQKMTKIEETLYSKMIKDSIVRNKIVKMKEMLYEL